MVLGKCVRMDQSMTIINMDLVESLLVISVQSMLLCLGCYKCGWMATVRRSSIVGSTCMSVALWTSSETHPGVEQMSGVSWDASDMPLKIVSFLGASSVAGSWMI